MTEVMYLIDGPVSNDNIVEVWSNTRLPFEPKGWLLDMKNDIRKAVKSMQGIDNTALHALYVSGEDGFCDVENILLYNVGTGAFTDLCRRGLCFERLIDEPRQPEYGVGKFLHYHRYSMIDLEAGPLYWAKEKSLANWNGVSCPALRGELKPHSFWYALKKAEINIYGKFEGSEYFGLELKINAPKGTRVNLAAVIKPLLDGTICALHGHEGTINPVVVGRLAQRIGEKEIIVENMLIDRATAILGTRNLIHTFGKGFQWNPADDLCIVTKVLLEDNIEDTTWSLDGEIFTVIPCSSR